jgi:hypothetical protein
MNNVQPPHLASEIIGLLNDIDSNLLYILKELPKNVLEEDLRRQVSLICQSFRSSLEERRGEAALAIALLHYGPDSDSVEVSTAITKLIRTISAGLATSCFDIQLAVAYLRRASDNGNKNAFGTVVVLVEESAANILNSFASFQRVFKTYLPPPSSISVD